MNLEQNEKREVVMKKILREILIYGAILFFCLYVNPNFVAARTDVVGDSMEGTLKTKDSLFMEKVSYYFRSPARFDIVVFDPKVDEGDYFVKRIIGLPGETIQIRDGIVYIDGVELDSDVYGNAKIDISGVAEEPFLIPAGEYFVMGDNRMGDNSWDSRDKKIGTIEKEKIVGRVAVRIYPFDSMRFFN